MTDVNNSENLVKSCLLGRSGGLRVIICYYFIKTTPEVNKCWFWVDLTVSTRVECSVVVGPVGAFRPPRSRKTTKSLLNGVFTGQRFMFWSIIEYSESLCFMCLSTLIRVLDMFNEQVHQKVSHRWRMRGAECFLQQSVGAPYQSCDANLCALYCYDHIWGVVVLDGFQVGLFYCVCLPADAWSRSLVVKTKDVAHDSSKNC